jgi:hypothetical protein
MIDFWVVEIWFPAGPKLKICDSLEEANCLVSYARNQKYRVEMWRM